MRPLIVLTALSAVALTTPAVAATDIGVTDAATVGFSLTGAQCEAAVGTPLPGP
jgi:hypothetical protein